MNIDTTINSHPIELSSQDKKFNFEFTSLDQAMHYSKLIAESDLAPTGYKGKPGNVLIAIQYGSEIGLKPLQSIQNIAVINGRPSLWGDAMLAVVQGHPVCEYIKETIQDNIAYCAVKRIGEEEHIVKFSLEDAKKAGLTNKPGPWTQYPSRMLQMRARAFALRDKFSDILKGICMREEVEDYNVIPVKNKEHAESKLSALLLEKEKSTDIMDKINSVKNVEDLKSLKTELLIKMKEKHSELTGEILST